MAPTKWKILVLTAVQLIMALHVELAVGSSPWTDMFVKYSGTGPVNDLVGPYMFDDPNRQHFHYALPPNASPSNPAPVLFHAHGNSGSAAGMPNTQIQKILSEGFALVSWASVTTIRSQEPENAPIDVATCMADLDLLVDWVKINGAAIGLSTTNFTISGRSRGSVISFAKAHSGMPEIKSIYLYNALPGDDISELLGLINENSPPLYVAYGPICPEPIITSGPNMCITYKIDDPETPNYDESIQIDIHNPKSGQKMVDRYNELGIGNKIGFFQGMEHTDPPIGNIFNFLGDLQDIVANQEEDEDDNVSLAAPMIRMPRSFLVIPFFFLAFYF